MPGFGPFVPFGPSDAGVDPSAGPSTESEYKPDLIQQHLNESGSPGVDYSVVTTSGGTVAYDANEHTGTQSLRIVRTSNAQVGVRAPTLNGVLNNGDNGTTFAGSFFLFVNSLPSTSLNVEIFAAAMNLTDNVLLTLNNLGELRIGRQSNPLVVSAPSATLLTTGQWYEIHWAFDFTSQQNMRVLAWVNQDVPVEANWSSRYGWSDVFVNARYGTMSAAPGVSNYDLVFDDGSIFRTAPMNTGLLMRTANETAAITSLEYDNVNTTGGTVAYSTAQFHEGTQSVRINRTSAAAVYAETLTFTKSPLGPGGLQHAELCGSFWIYVAARPSGVGDTTIFTIYHPVNSNVDISLSNTGQVRMRQQAGALSGGVNSAYSATTVPLNAWTQIFWTMDGNTGTLTGTVAVGSDPPQTVTWSQAAEVPPWVDYGCKTFTVASTYDIYFDDAYVYEGLIYPTTANTGYTLQSVTSAGVGVADEVAPNIRLPARSSAGTSTATATNLVILQPFPTTVILDDFNRADTGPPPSGNWTTNLSNSGHGLQVVGNQLANVSATGDNAEGYWSAASYGPDVDVYLTIANKPTSGTGNRSSINELYGRVSNPGAAVSAYGARYRYIDDGTDQATFSVVKYLAGTQTLLITTSRVTALAIGDKFGLRVVGTSIQVWAKRGAGTWTMMTSATDPDVTGAGRVGFHSSITLYTGNLLWDDLGAGTYTSVYTLGSVTSAGSGSATATGLRIRLPNQTSAGAGTTTGQAFRIKLPVRTSVGAGTATAAAPRIGLPARTSAGTGSLAANNIKIRLPARTSASTSTATATALRLGLHATSAGASTATAQAFRIRLPNLTSAGIGTLAANNIKIRLPARTTAGVATASTAIRLLLPVRTSVGTSTATATALRIKLPNRTSAGVATATAVGFRDRFPNVTSAGVGTLTGNNLKIRLPARTSAGVGTADETALQLTGGATGFPAVTSVGTSTATATGLRIRLPAMSTAGAGTSTATAFRIKLPSRTSVGTGTLSGNAIRINLPSRTSVGTATATAVGFRDRFPNVTTAGVGSLTGNNVKIRLPNRSSAGVATASATLAPRLPARTSAGTSTATATAFRIRLPNRTSAGVGTLAANNIKIKLPSISTTGGAGISLARDHGINSSASASTTLTIPTTAAVAVGDYLVITGTSSSGTATLQSIAVTSGVDPGNLSWTGWDAIGNATGAFIAWTRCPTGVNNAVTFTVTWSGVAFGTRRLGLTEWAGVASASAQDAHQGAVSSSSATSPTVNITTISNNDVVIAGISIQNATTLTPNGSFIEIHDDNGGSRTHGTIYQLTPSPGTYAPGATAALTNHWAISSLALVGAPLGGSGSNAVAGPLRLGLSSQAAGVGSISANNIKIRLPSRTAVGSASTSVTNIVPTPGPYPLPAVASPGSSTATAAGLRIRLPSRSSAGTGTATASGLRIRLPVRTSAGTSTATGVAFRIRLPNLTSAGVGSVSANNIKIRLPNRTSAGVGSTSQALRIRLPNRTSAGVGSVAGNNVKIRLPNRTSAGVGTTNTTNLAGAVSNLQSVTSVGTATATAQGFRIRLPARSTAGTGTTSAALRIRLPARSSAGTSTATAIALRIRLIATSAGTSTATAQAFRIRLPARTTAGTGTLSATPSLRIRLPSRISAGAATATAQVTLQLPRVGGTWALDPGSPLDPGTPLIPNPFGVGRATAQALQIQLPSRTSAGTATATAVGFRSRLPSRTSSGTGTATGAGLRIRLPARTALGSSSTSGRLSIRLPARSVTGSSNATVTGLRVGIIVLTSHGDSDAVAQGLQIRLPHIFSNGDSDTFAGAFIYFPPPPKGPVIAGTTSHTLVAGITDGTVIVSPSDHTLTVGTSGDLPAIGDLTRVIQVGP